MKQPILILSLAVVALGSCKKKSDSTPVPPPSLPTYTVDGIHDLYITSNSPTSSIISLPLTVTYQDSFQKEITLSLSDLPGGIVMDTNWITTGYPTFSSMITLYDTSSTAHAATGTYPMTLTATGAAGTKKFTFNVNVLPETSCIDNIIGIYSNCTTTCNTSYADTIVADPGGLPNKFWFRNIGKTGKMVYAMFNCTTSTFTIPAQSIAGFSYSGSGYLMSGSSGYTLSINITYGTNNCHINM